jgi:UDP-N-acetylmuramoyl-L-alanyl-D-glutamate--2,6-diaminopimelate ligase
MCNSREDTGTMTLSDLLISLPEAKVIGQNGLLKEEILGITKDSRSAHPGFVFFATEASKTYVAKVLEQGVKVVVSDEPVVSDIPCTIIVSDVRSSLARMAARFFGYPSRNLFVAGVTGTNGKTTITYLSESIVHAAGKSVGVMGTISYRYKGHSTKAQTTTPESVEIQSVLRSMGDEHVDYAVMEASSHALDQHRVEAVDFDCAIFTNLTHDHLDYHGDIENYLQAKKLLFHTYLVESVKAKKWAIINIDDKTAPFFVPDDPITTMTYSTRTDADAHVVSFSESINGLELELSLQGSTCHVTSPLVGMFNVSNILAAALFGRAAGFSLDVIKKGIESLSGVPGRLERVPNNRGIHVFIDYAHTPDALQNTIETLNHVRSGRLITVFGCGGGRDKTKRPVMGKIASELSDVAIVTSDNPRNEDPMAIIDHITAGMKGGSHKIMENRRSAIEAALNMAHQNDVVLIAGKGHEDYQIIGNVTYPFSDRAVIEEILSVEC